MLYPLLHNIDIACILQFADNILKGHKMRFSPSCTGAGTALADRVGKVELLNPFACAFCNKISNINNKMLRIDCGVQFTLTGWPLFRIWREPQSFLVVVGSKYGLNTVLWLLPVGRVHRQPHRNIVSYIRTALNQWECDVDQRLKLGVLPRPLMLPLPHTVSMIVSPLGKNCGNNHKNQNRQCLSVTHMSIIFSGIIPLKILIHIL